MARFACSKPRAKQGRGSCVFATSAAIYGEVAESDLPISESQPRRPLSPYGISKAVVLSYLEATSRHFGLEWSALALANVYGPRQSSDGEAGVVARFADHLRRDEQPTIFGDGEQQRDFIFVGDAVDAFLLAMNHGAGLVLNIGTGHGVSVNELWRELANTARSDLAPIYAPRREGDLQASRLDSTLAKSVLGWSATTSLRAGLEQDRRTKRHQSCRLLGPLRLSNQGTDRSSKAVGTEQLECVA